LFPAKFEELFDENAVFESGFGKVIVSWTKLG